MKIYLQDLIRSFPWNRQLLHPLGIIPNPHLRYDRDDILELVHSLAELLHDP